MHPTKEMYQGPRDLLEKAKRDQETLAEELASWDCGKLPDSLFNFSVTVYHVLDWVKAYKPDLEKAAYEWLNSHRELGVFRDLSNASKHVKLNVDGPAYRKYPPVLGAAEPSATSETIVQTSGPKCRLKIESQDGTRLAVEEWAKQAVAAWERFFSCHAL